MLSQKNGFSNNSKNLDNSKVFRHKNDSMNRRNQFENNNKSCTVDLRTIYDMEDIDYQNKGIPEEVAPYAKQIFSMLREKEVGPLILS